MNDEIINLMQRRIDAAIERHNQLREESEDLDNLSGQRVKPIKLSLNNC